MEGQTILKRIFAILGILIVLGYSYFVLDDFVRGPRIIISSPENGFSTTTPVIEIVGKAIHTNNLTINDSPTPVDLAGNFSTRLILAPGYNIIKVAAKDNYTRIIEKTLEIVLVVPGGETGTTTATTTQTRMEPVASTTRATSTGA